MSTTKHIICCDGCNIIFKKQGFYEKHKIKCEQQNKGDVMPTINDLQNMIKDLTEKYNNVQSELYSLKQKISVKQKKIDTLNWLNENIQNLNDFEEKINKMNIDEHELEVIFKNGFIGGIALLITELFDESDGIKCFNHKTNIIYIFRNGTWEEMKLDYFVKIMSDINIKVLRSFNIYEERNREKIKNEMYNGDFQSKYKIILGNNMTFENKARRIYNQIYRDLKSQFTPLIEIEIK